MEEKISVLDKSPVIGVNQEVLLTELPPKPDWFDEELKKIGLRDGQPLFRIVDGQRETHFRAGRQRIKHLLMDGNRPCFIPVVKQVFYRENKETKERITYSSLKEAEEDSDENLLETIFVTNLVQIKEVGKPCWVIETYISPDEIGEKDWNENRFKFLYKSGIYQKVDLLGEFPKEGMYVYCFPVLDKYGNARSPSQIDIDECKKRLKLVESDKKTLSHVLQEMANREQEFERKQIERITDNVFQYFGLSMRKFYGAAIG